MWCHRSTWFCDKVTGLNNENIILYTTYNKEKYIATIKEALNDNISIDNISIFGLDGKKIMIQNNNSNYIDVSFLSKGIYYLSIKHDNKVSVKKFIKD